MGMSSTNCAKRAGITYRQFDHWSRQGYIPVRADTTHGIHRNVTEEQCAFVVKVAKLVRAGVPVGRASEILQSLDPDVTEFHLTPEVKAVLV